MSGRRLIAAFALLWLWPSAAIAEDGPAGNQELGAELGLALGGGVTPGGLQLGGRYLYRLADVDWFDGAVGFTFGGGQASCFRDRDDSLVCDHGALDGIAVDVSAGIRRYFAGRNKFHPYLHGGVAARVLTYGDDDLLGFAVPLWVGGGVRAEVSEGVSVGGGAMLLAGPAWLDRGLGLEPQVSLAISAGVEFRID